MAKNLINYGITLFLNLAQLQILLSYLTVGELGLG